MQKGRSHRQRNFSLCLVSLFFFGMSQSVSYGANPKRDWKPFPYKPVWQPDFLPPESPSQFQSPELPKGEKTINEIIFTRNLMRDLRRRYEELFGAFEASYISPTFPQLESLWGEVGPLTLRDQIDERRDAIGIYGRYVLRKILEHHIDLSLKEGSQTQKVYEIKEKITQAQLQVARNMRLKVKYSVSGQSLDGILSTSFLEFRYQWLQRTARQRISNVQEHIMTVAVPGPLPFSTEINYKTIDGVAQLILRRVHTKSLSSSYTFANSVHSHGDSDRERLVIAGLNYQY